MTTRAVVLLTVIALSVCLPTWDSRTAQAYQDRKTDQKAAPSVAGRWSAAFKGSPHGDVTMGLELEQNGKKVTGTLATPHGDDLQVEGEFSEGTLTLATPGEGESRITMTAKLKEDGTLDGYLSSQMRDMTWTARRSTGK